MVRRLPEDPGRIRGTRRKEAACRGPTARRLPNISVGLVKRLGVHALTRHITVIRSVFKHAYEANLLERPMRFGAGFRKPTAAQVRKARGKAEVENGKKLFTPDDVTAILEASVGWLRTAVLLGINGGFGNTDCARLPWSAVDLEGALITYSRPKTGVERIVPLWPEATAALRAVRSSTPTKIGATGDGLVFATVRGLPLVRQIVRQAYETEGGKMTNVDEAATRFATVLKALEKNRRGVGFYTLRHTFRTWADEFDALLAHFSVSVSTPVHSCNSTIAQTCRLTCGRIASMCSWSTGRIVLTACGPKSRARMSP